MAFLTAHGQCNFVSFTVLNRLDRLNHFAMILVLPAIAACSSTPIS